MVSNPLNFSDWIIQQDPDSKVSDSQTAPIF